MKHSRGRLPLPSKSELWDDELYERPGHLIRRIYQIITALFFEETAGLGFTQLQYLVLRSIMHHPNSSQRRLGEYVALDRTTVGWIIDSLERKGLVQRKADPKDRRQRGIEISPIGLEKIRRIEPMVNRLQARILAPLPKAQRMPFLKGLKIIVETYNEYSRAPLRQPRIKKTARGKGR